MSFGGDDFLSWELVHGLGAERQYKVSGRSMAQLIDHLVAFADVFGSAASSLQSEWEAMPTPTVHAGISCWLRVSTICS